MKLTYKYYNGCYWLVISNQEELDLAIPNFFIYEHAYANIEEKFAIGTSLMINPKGGYHYASKENIVDYTDEVKTESFRHPVL